VPWCATTQIYNGSWGECACSPLRRGAAVSTPVHLDTQGPMYSLHATALENLLGPLAVRSGGTQDVEEPEAMGAQSQRTLEEELREVNGTMEAFYPVFDETLQGALDLRVLFVPSEANACLSPPPPIPTPTTQASAVASYPTGNCERIGLITELIGHGVSAQEVCATFPLPSLLSGLAPRACSRPYSFRSVAWPQTSS
jgi:hypothetical protein